MGLIFEDEKEPEECKAFSCLSNHNCLDSSSAVKILVVVIPVKSAVNPRQHQPAEATDSHMASVGPMSSKRLTPHYSSTLRKKRANSQKGLKKCLQFYL